MLLATSSAILCPQIYSTVVCRERQASVSNKDQTLKFIWLIPVSEVVTVSCFKVAEIVSATSLWCGGGMRERL